MIRYWLYLSRINTVTTLWPHHCKVFVEPLKSIRRADRYQILMKQANVKLLRKFDNNQVFDIVQRLIMNLSRKFVKIRSIAIVFKGPNSLLFASEIITVNGAYHNCSKFLFFGTLSFKNCAYSVSYTFAQLSSTFVFFVSYFILFCALIRRGWGHFAIFGKNNPKITLLCLASPILWISPKKR